MSPAPDQWAEMLGLEDEVVARVGRRTLQWAQALAQSDEGSTRQAVEAGALYRLAAGYLLLVPDVGRDACAEAAVYLQTLDDSYANPLAVCAGGPERVWAALDRPPNDERLDPAERAHELTALAWAAVTTDEPGARRRYWDRRSESEPVAPLPANRLGLPLATTMALLDAAVSHSPERLARAVDEMLSRIDDVFGAAMLDHYHWQRLMSRVMPVEPEIVAPLAVAVAVAGGAEQEIERRAPARVALDVASWIAGAQR
jgi:hypothetical protein